jgi:hypothetical protein
MPDAPLNDPLKVHPNEGIPALKTGKHRVFSGCGRG